MRDAHFAGELGVSVFDSFIRNRWLTLAKGDYTLTRLGRAKVSSFGIDLADLEAGARPLCRGCLDWSVRRHHLAGSVGAALLDHIFARGWAKRRRSSRVLEFSRPGEAALKRAFALNLDA